jgi:hypothetical protein
MSDPRAFEKLFDNVAPALEADENQHHRELTAAWEQLLADGRAVYEGEVRARPVMRGVILDDIETAPDVDTWLAEALGLDDWHGGSRRARLIVEPLERPDTGDGEPLPRRSS